jgi:hypothetical protein
MNTTGMIGESQAVARFSSKDGWLSHKEQLASQNRSERRLFNLISRQLSPKQRAALRFKRSVRFQFWKLIAEFYKSLTPAFDRLMGEFLKFGHTFDTMRASAITIAKRVGCCRDTVQEFLRELRRRGFLVLDKRRWNNSSVRRLHPEFFSVNLKMRFWKKFDAYRDYFQKANHNLKLWLLFQKDPTLELSILNISRFSKDDIQLYEDINTQSREVIPTYSSKGVSPMEDLNYKIRTAIDEGLHAREALQAKRIEVATSMSELLKERVTNILQLTTKGRIKLLRYCDGALLYGLESLAHHGTIDNQLNFRLFEAACIEYCRNNEIKVDTDRHDNLLKELGYVDSQPYCKKIILPSPLQPRKAPTPLVEKPQDSKPTVISKDTERSRYAALDPSLRDPIIALALRLGYEDRLDLPQISNEKLDLIE